MQQLNESITNIEALIPAQATVENILADRDFVNSSINSVTAFYITSDIEGSPFATKAALDNAAVYYYAGAERVPTANDYCVVLEDETHENKTVRYVYQSTEAGEGTWAFQYVVNNTSFTADQLAALNSGITASKVTQIDTNTSAIAGFNQALDGKSNIGHKHSVNDVSFTSDQLAAINSGITAAKVSKYDSLEDLIAKVKAEAILAAWPVGSIFIGTTAFNPSYLLGGGTWEQFGGGRCLIGVGTGYDGTQSKTFIENETGGEYYHKLTTGEMPSHTHTFTGSAVTSGANSRGHTHSVGQHSHTINSGNTSSAGTTTTAGFRGVNVTSSADGSHSHYIGVYNNKSANTWYDNSNKPKPMAVSGNFGLPPNTESVGDNISLSGRRIGIAQPSLDFNWNSSGFDLRAGNSKAHTHSITTNGYLYGKTDNSTSFNTGAESQNHTHSVTAAGTNDSTGGGNSHNNLPPYITVYMWKRTA